MSSSLQSALLLVLILAATALFTGKDRANKQRFEDRETEVTSQKKEIADLRRDMAEGRRQQDDDRARFEAELARRDRRDDEKDRTISDLREQVARLRIGIINLGGDPDAVLEDSPAHPGQRSNE